MLGYVDTTESPDWLDWLVGDVGGDMDGNEADGGGREVLGELEGTPTPDEKDWRRGGR